MPEEYYGQRYEDLNRQLGMRERARKRQSGESLASQGSFYSGARQASERQIEGEMDEAFLQGRAAIEDQREAARQAELQRQHTLLMQSNMFGENAAQRQWQTGERVGTQSWTTGERVGSQEHQSALQQMAQQHAAEMQQAGFSQEEIMAALQQQYGLETLGAQHGYTMEQMGGQFGFQQQLQAQAEQAKMQLQELVQSGQMDLQTAEQQWQGIQNELSRELEQWQSSGQWAHEGAMQSATIAQDQWSQQFGANVGYNMLENTQAFEEQMAQMGRDWELADRDWESQMWQLDAQLQLALGGWDWNNDGQSGGMPTWLWTDEYGLNPGAFTYQQNPAGGYYGVNGGGGNTGNISDYPGLVGPGMFAGMGGSTGNPQQSGFPGLGDPGYWLNQWGWS